MKYNRARLFVASCIALAATAMTFSIRADILSAFGLEFDLSHQQQGWINTAGIWGFPLAILVLGPLVDVIGMGRLLAFACLCHIAGVSLTILSPSFGFTVLLAATLVIGIANGTVEAVVNPLCATMYADRKTQRLNALHAWWPGGLIVGGLTAYLLGRFFDASWQLKMAAVFVPVVIYGLMLIGQKFPLTERAEAGVTGGQMFREAVRPGYVILLVCMLMTATTELGPDQWVGSVLTDTVGIRGILFLVYTSGLMFILRFYAGPIAHRVTPLGLLFGSAILSAIGLFWLSGAFTPLAAFMAATVFGVGKTYFWPTMLGVTSERYPRGGSLLLAMTGAFGMFAAGAAGPIMGSIYDTNTIVKLPDEVKQVVVVKERGGVKHVVSGEAPFSVKHEVAVKERYSPAAKSRITAEADLLAMKEAEKYGAAMTFQRVAVLPLVLIVFFGGMLIYYKRHGGYRALRVSGGRN